MAGARRHAQAMSNPVSLDTPLDMGFIARLQRLVGVGALNHRDTKAQRFTE
jgi:hypothetical protein